jgi:hypothetical protein
MRLHRLPSIIAPWPNAAFTVSLAVVIWYLLRRGHDNVPLVFGVIVGFVPAVIDALTRSSMRSALRSAANSVEVITAYSFPSLAACRHYLGIVLLIVAGYVVSDYSPDSDAVAVMLAGFIFVHFLSHAILGFWTAWPTDHD